MSGILLLAAVTLFYAGYNIFIKVSGNHVPADATSTIFATICLQLAALSTSLVFLGFQATKGGHVFGLTGSAYMWAAVAGLCIGAAEIGYLYLFGGVGSLPVMPANVAIPTIVSGTIVIALIASFFFLRETIGLYQIAGSVLILLGIAVFFMKSGAQAH